MNGEQPQGVLPGTISMVFGHPDAETLPVALLKDAAQAVLDGSQARLALQYGPERGTPILVDYLVEKLNRDEALGLTRDNLMLRAGSTHAVDTVARLHARCGGVVLVEAPTYHDALNVFRDHGADLRSVVIDDDGMRIDALEAQLAALAREDKSPALLYTIPNFQNPSGVTITQARREAVLKLAREHGFLIVEDDVYRDLAFEVGDAPPSFYALAGGEGVVRIGSFSKIMAPGLRLGWLVAAPEHIARYMACGATQMSGGANPFVAHVVAEYCCAGHLEPQIVKLRAVYKHRCAVTLDALARHMPPGTIWTEPRGGFFVWLTLPAGVDAGALRARARARGVDFVPGAGFYAGGGEAGKNKLRLAFSFVPPEDIEKGIKVLGELVAAL